MAWAALAPLHVIAYRAPVKRGIALGFVLGSAFFGALLVWISMIGWIAWVLLVVLQASFIALYVGAWGVASRRSSTTWRVAAAPAMWVTVEYIRSFIPLGGLTWGQLAQSQHNTSWLLSPARFGGGWIVSFLVLLANALLAEAWLARREQSIPKAAGLAAAAAAILAAPALIPEATANGAALRVAVVQGNVPRHFAGSAFDKELLITSSHERLTRQLAGKGIDLVVWPESSVGLDFERNPEAAAAISSAARAVGSPMIVGGNLDVDADHYKVEVFEVAPAGEVVDRYQKTHLVPFGEYVPARRWLEWLPILDQIPRDAIAGSEPTLFDVAGGRVAPVISYEGDFGPLVRERIEAGGRLLVVATNTSTWGTSWASAQHVAFSQVRAAENSVWAVHASLSGISAFIAPDGTIVKSTPLWKATSAIQDLRFAEDASLYARTGDWLPIVCALISLVALVLGIRTRAPWSSSE